ncbi:tetratricopeptide repeat protein [Streptomyces sp. NPDC101393]|uniref:tetratricopeptide repeat protein n=1 Tax=Streptomyces sp. NPDC101393 TaxID=3366141 RepID=UPI003813E8C5
MSGFDGAARVPGQRAQAYDQGRIFQASGDQYITEQRIFVQQAPGARATEELGPCTVRAPLAGRTPPVLRDRRELMRRLREALAAGGESHVLHGMGGCGKTAVAHALFQEAQREAGRDCFWINAADRLTLRAGMLGVAAELGASNGELAAAHAGRRPPADLVWRYLGSAALRWLLVIDNADDVTVLEEGGWLRSCELGTVVVTSRVGAAPVWRESVRHPVGVLPLADAARALCDLAPDAGSVEDAELVARRLGCLPLALHLAGSYMGQPLLEVCSMTDYHQRLEDDEPTALLDQGAAPGAPSSRQLIGTTWQLSLDALAADGAPEAVSLLRLLSFWSAEPLPVSLLSRVGGALLPTGRLESALRGLLAHSLVALTAVPGASDGPSVRCAQTHGVLLDSVHTGVPDDERAALLDHALRPLESAADGPEPLRLITPHVRALLGRTRAGDAAGERVVRLAVRVTRQVYEAGDWTGALALGEATAARGAAWLGADHAAAIEARLSTGPVLFRLGRYEEGEALLRAARETALRVLGADDVRTLDAGFELQRVLHRLGRLDEARGLLDEVLAGRLRVLGASHPLTLKARCELLELRIAQEDFAGYDTAATALVADCDRHLGDAHLITVWALDAQAKGLLRDGRAAEAEGVLRRVLAGQRAGYGDAHPLVLGVVLALSRAQAAQDKRAAALAGAREVAEGRSRMLGEDHPETTAAREWLTTLVNR